LAIAIASSTAAHIIIIIISKLSRDSRFRKSWLNLVEFGPDLVLQILEIVYIRLELGRNAGKLIGEGWQSRQTK